MAQFDVRKRGRFFARKFKSGQVRLAGKTADAGMAAGKIVQGAPHIGARLDELAAQRRVGLNGLQLIAVTVETDRIKF